MRLLAFNETQRGFTLMEVLVTSALLGPVLISLFMTMETMQWAYTRGEGRADQQQSARIGLARMVRDLRAAGLDPSAVIPRLPTPAAIQTAETSRIAFIGDANGDGRSRKIEYRLDLSAEPPVLRRQQWSTWNNGWSGTNGAQPQADGITSVEFTYYGTDGTPVPLGELPAKLGEIRRVGIAITATARATQIPTEAYRLLSEVRIRNVGL